MKKLFAALLALILIFGAVSPVFAEEGETEPSGEEPVSSEQEPGNPDNPDDPDNPDNPDEPEEPTHSEIPGDVTDDGTVTGADARLILRRAVELEAFEPWQEALADLDEDGVISASDARGALRLAVGLPLGETEAERLAREERERREREEEERRRKEEEERQRQEDLKKTREGYMTLLSEAVSRERIASTMNALVNDLPARAFGTARNKEAADWIVGQLKNSGFSDIRRWGFTYEGVNGENLVAVIPAKRENAQILLFVAHYDSVATTGGAVDNSSGVSLMLELARVLKAENKAFDYEVRFLFSTAEEIGYVGCYRYCSYVSSSVGGPETFSRHALAFNADMAGCPNFGGPWYLAVSTETCYNPGGAVANAGSRACDHAKTLLGNLGEAGYYSPVAAGQTDIRPFIKYGLPSVNVSWRQIDHSRAHGSDYGLASPYTIHTWDDSIANFNMDSLYNMTRLTAAAAGDLLFTE